MFLLTDSQITNERFLIYVNDLLASGNIPDLFAVDEVDAIVSGVRCTQFCGWFPAFSMIRELFVDGVESQGLLQSGGCFVPLNQAYMAIFKTHMPGSLAIDLLASYSTCTYTVLVLLS